MPNNKSDLSILINAVLNEELSKDTIKKQLQRIQSDPKFNRLKLNVQLDDSALKSLNAFVDSVKKIQSNISQTTHQHGQQVNEEIRQITKTSAKYTAQNIEEAKRQLRSAFGDDSVISTQTFRTGKGNLKSFLVDVKDAQGQIQRVNYEIREFIKKNDAGEIISRNKAYVSTMIQEIDKVEAELNKQKNIAQKKLQDLARTGKYTTEELRKIGQGLNLATSINQIDQLNNRMKNMRVGTTLAQDQENFRNSLVNVFNQGKLNERQFTKFNNSINSAKNISELEKLRKELTSVTTVNNASTLQQKLSSDAEKLLRTHTNTVDVAGVQNLITRINGIDPASQKATNGLKRLQTELQLFRNDAQEAARSSMTFGTMLSTAMEKFPIWMIASTAFYLPIRLTSQLVDTLYLLDERLVSIDKVLENADMSAVFENATNAAMKYGQTIDGVLESLGEISKLGFNQADAETLNNNAMLLSTVGEFQSNADAANYLVAIMRQYKLEVSDTAKVVDSLNNVSNKTGADTVSLAQGLSKSSSAAAMAGVNFHELNGMIANTQEVLKISGNEAGTFYKTLFSRYLRPETQSDIEAIGVATKTVTGELRSATDVLKDVGDAWGTLDTQTQNALATQLGGVWHVNKVTSLLENQDNVLKNIDYSMNSYGSATDELTTFQSGLRYQTNQMIGSFQQLAWVLGENGVRDGLLLLIEGVTSLTQDFTELTEATNGWNLKLPILIGLVYGGVKAFGALKLAIQGVKASFGLIGLGVVALETLSSVFMKVGTSASANTESLTENAKQMSEQTKQIQFLLDRYNELEPQAKNNTDKQKELHSVLENIQKLAPHLIESTGKYGNALTLNKDKADEYVKSLMNMTDEQVRQAKTANSIEIANVNVDIDKEQEKLNNMESKVKEVFDRISEYQGQYNVSGLLDAEEEYNKRREELARQADRAIADGNKELASSITIQLTNALNEYAEYVKLMENSGEDLTIYSETFNKIEELRTKKIGIEERQKALNELNSSVQNITVANEKNADSLSKVAKGNYEVDESMGESSDATNVQKTSLESLQETMSKVSEDVTLLSQAEQELQEEGRISQETLDKLMVKYDDFGSHLGLTKEELLKFIIAKKSERTDFINTEIEKTNTLIEESKKRLKALELEGNAYRKQLQGLVDSGIMTKSEMLSRVNSNELYSGYTDEIAKLDELQTRSNYLQYTLDNINSSSNKSSKEKNKKDKESIYITDEYKNAMAELNLELERLNKLKSKYPEHSNEYRKAVEKEIALTKEQIKLNADYQKDIQKQLSTGKIKPTGMIDKEKVSTQTKQTVNNVVGKIDGINQTFLERLSKLAQDYGKKIEITSGYRSIAKQQELWNKSDKTGKTVAKPGSSAHNYQIAADVGGWLKNLSNDELAKYGLYKPMSYENWHVEPIETKSNGRGKDAFVKVNELLKGQSGSFTSTGYTQAEYAQSLDQLAESFRGATQEGYNLQEQLDQLNLAYVNAKNAQFDYNKSYDESYISNLQKQRERLNNTSQEYINSVADENKHLAYQQSIIKKQIAYNQEKIKSDEFSASAKDELKSKIIELNLAYADLTNAIIDNNNAMNDSKFNAVNDQIDDLDFQIQQQEILKDTQTEGSDEYIASTKEINRITQDKINLMQQQIDLTTEELTLQKANSDRAKELRERIEDLTIAQMELQKTQRENLNNIANDIIQIYKDAYEKQKEVVLDAIDEELDALEKSHDRKIEMLDAENEKIQESIDLKRKQIDQEESERDFTKQRGDLQKQLQELDNRIATQDLDKSDESQSKVIDLQKERAEIVEQLDELQHDRQVELRQQNLDELSDDFQKEYDQKKKVEDDKYNKEKESIEKRKKLQEEYYDNLINDERKYAQVREEIMNGNLSNLQGQLGEFSEYIQDNMSSIGESISQNLLDKIAQAQEQLKNVNSMSVSIPSSTPSSNSGSNNNNDTSNQKQLPSGWTGSTESSLFFKDGSISYGVDKSGYIYKNGNFVPAENYKYIPDEVIEMAKKRKMGVYHEGGIVGGIEDKDSKLINSLFNIKPNEQIIKALKGEVVVNPSIGVPNFINNMQNLLSGFKPQIAGIPTGDNYEINLNIDKFNGTKKEAESTAKTIRDILKRRGK